MTFTTNTRRPGYVYSKSFDIFFKKNCLGCGKAQTARRVMFNKPCESCGLRNGDWYPRYIRTDLITYPPIV